ncbi:MAG: hypothetical protein AAF601_10095 [Pseudomonadota bacterium]
MRRLIFLMLLASPAAAQDWAVRSGDAMLSGDALRALIDGQELVFFDNGRSKFSTGGSYSYTYANGGGTAFGAWRIDDDTVCIAFRNGFSRCDRYVRSGARVVMLTQKGERFPVR